MEGISHEACSLAGTLGLNKLIALYDDNGISIDGKVEGWFTDDTPKRFEAYGWNVIPNVDGHDVDAVDAAIAQAKQSDKPDPDLLQDHHRQGLAEPAGRRQGRTAPRWATRKSRPCASTCGWDAMPFDIPARKSTQPGTRREAGAASRSRVEQAVRRATARKYPQEGRRIRAPHAKANCRPTSKRHWPPIIAGAIEKKETIATRKASQNAIQAWRPCCRNSWAARPT